MELIHRGGGAGILFFLINICLWPAIILYIWGRCIEVKERKRTIWEFIKDTGCVLVFFLFFLVGASIASPVTSLMVDDGLNGGLRLARPIDNSSVYIGGSVFSNNKLNGTLSTGVTYYIKGLDLALTGELDVTGVKEFKDKHLNFNLQYRVDDTLDLLAGIENVLATGNDNERPSSIFLSGTKRFKLNPSLTLITGVGVGTQQLKGIFGTVGLEYKELTIYTNVVLGKLSPGASLEIGNLLIEGLLLEGKNPALTLTYRVELWYGCCNY
jgi:hypothetical protein